MSVREEDRQRNCPSRGLGIAAAAIGVGVGAAVYYFFSKREENPDVSGSTSNWTSEEAYAFENCHEDSVEIISDISTNEPLTNTESDQESSESNMSTSDSEESLAMIESSIGNSYEDTSDNFDMTVDSEHGDVTTSEHSTSDTNIYDSPLSETSILTSLEEELAAGLNLPVHSELSYFTISEHSTSDTSIHDSSLSEFFGTQIVHYNVIDISSPNIRTRFVYSTADNQESREREWKVEECSICFESMQREQEVMSLPCSHRFHQPCILPWLQERQTCPNCRKEA